MYNAARLLPQRPYVIARFGLKKQEQQKPKRAEERVTRGRLGPTEIGGARIAPRHNGHCIRVYVLLIFVNMYVPTETEPGV